MSAATSSLQLRTALMTTGLLQPVSSSDNPKNFWVMCRIVPGQEPAWLRVVETILVSHEQDVDWVDKPEIILARRYVAKDGKMVFGWYISVIAKSVKDLDKATLFLQRHLEDARPTLTPVTQAPQRAPEPAVRALAPGQHPRPRAQDARAAGEALSNPEPPRDFAPSIKIVKKGFDDKGRLETVEEMPLPHVYKELNTPNARGKGAWKDGAFHATGGRK